ncbi:MAG: autotransporter domain-containing protein, partial [Alphaproteobacteria bacterium]|nr:autotransporter domain-containing protein [Alphaproteobacteria bacterium]
ASVIVTTGSTSDAGTVSAIYSTGNIKNTANGALTVTMSNSGSANVYGIYGTTATNTIENDAIIEVNSAGTSGYAIGIYGDGEKITNKNTVTVTSTQTEAGVSAMYGLQLNNASATSQIENTHKIELIHNGKNEAYMSALSANGIITNDGELSVASNGTGALSGIYTTGSVTNGGSGSGTAGNISITRLNTSVAETGVVGIHATGNVANGGNITIETGATNNSIYGIYSTGTTVTNTGGIQITVNQAVGDGKTTNVFGIYTEGSAVTNSGNITINTPNTTPDPNVNAYGIYAKGGSVQNTGTITLDGSSNNLYGIYADNGATVSNSGSIIIKNVPANPIPNGTTPAGNYIVLNSGSLVNAGTLSFEGSLNLNDFGGKTVLGKGGVFKADTLSGNLVAGSSLVTEGNETVYTAENVLQSDDTSGLNLTSGSALFDATTDGKNVVMTMKDFSEVYGDTNLTSFMDKNYANGTGIGMFQTLKSSETLEELLGKTAQETGASLLPNFAQENFGVYRSLNRAMNNSLFTEKGDKRAVVAYDMLYQNRKDKGTLTGYDNYANTVYGLFDRKVTDNLSLGGGLSITHFHSSYDDDSSRNELMFQAFAPITYDFNSSVRLVSMPRIGYSFGDYKRYATNSTHEGDIQNITYGISNEIRKVIPTDFVNIEPAVEFNVLGYRQQKIKESKRDGALILDATNYVSVEGGLGLYADKRIPFENSTLGIRMGGAYYHEFADPYSDIEAQMHQMSGGYTLSGKGLDKGLKNKRDRGLLNAKVTYDWRDWSFYASFTQFIENDSRLNANVGASLKF